MDLAKTSTRPHDGDGLLMVLYSALAATALTVLLNLFVA